MLAYKGALRPIRIASLRSRATASSHTRKAASSDILISQHRSSIMRKYFLLLSALAVSASAQIPQAEISNGVIKAQIYLPDAVKGYYLGTRFDWSGSHRQPALQRATIITGPGSRKFSRMFTTSYSAARRSSRAHAARPSGPWKNSAATNRWDTPKQNLDKRSSRSVSAS